MTQQPYYPPPAPQQGYPPQPPAQQPQYQPPQQPYAPPQQGYPPVQGYPPQPGYGQQPQAPAQPLVQGTLDDYYNQPTAGGGPSVVWSLNNGAIQKPLGTTYVGIVARDVAAGDVQQDTDPKTGQGKFYRDGRPRFVMKVPLKQVMTGPSPQQVGPNPQEYPEGEAQWFVRGQARDELTRAVTAAGLEGNTPPKEGDVIQITLVERRPSRGGGNPANHVQVVFQPGPRHQAGAAVGGQQASQPAAAPDPAAGAVAPSPVPAPVQQVDPATAYPPQWAQPVQQPQAPAQQPAQQQGPPPQWAQPQQAPVQQPAQQLQPPAGLDPGQQELLARLQQAQQQQG